MPESASAEPRDERVVLSLNDAATHLLEECRMILPGIQALFGFQMVAVFNARFNEALSSDEQRLHLAAIVVVVIAIALVMAPAALHRQLEPRAISQHFMDLSSRLLMWSMLPLALGICLDLYLVARLASAGQRAAGGISAALFVVFTLVWFVLPRSRWVRRTIAGK
jgi:hypothetical protein